MVIWLELVMRKLVLGKNYDSVEFFTMILKNHDVR
jgi:hypothetical protein